VLPEDEAQPFKVLFYKFQVGMYTLLSPMQAELPPIDADPQADVCFRLLSNSR
jgi:hypothetical protein